VQTAKSPSRSHKYALKSAHFVLSGLPPAAHVKLVNTLFMAIPKRLLKRAVDRNAVKRVCREAWFTTCADTSGLEIKQATGKPRLVKLVNLPKFNSTVELKKLIRADIDDLFSLLK
jgi:hypothetical protein